MADEVRKISELVQTAHRVVIVQADNPDGDSLGSALALEQILGDLGKEPYLYCGVGVPTYLRYMPGWDRVEKELPKDFDLSIIVDTNAISLLECLEKSNQMSLLTQRSCIIIDHHSSEATIPFASVIYNQAAVATGEAIYGLAQQLQWPLNLTAKERITSAIMSDSLGLTTEATTATSLRVVADLVEGGVSLSKLDNARRELLRKKPALVHYKGQLLERIEYHYDNQIATIIIPWEEIEKYSYDYNPSILVLDDMRMTIDTRIAIAFKLYKDGKITAKIRCNAGGNIADKLAEHYGGGGHPYAAGFKITDGRAFDTLKNDCIATAYKLLKQRDTNQNETV